MLPHMRPRRSDRSTFKASGIRTIIEAAVAFLGSATIMAQQYPSFDATFDSPTYQTGPLNGQVDNGNSWKASSQITVVNPGSAGNTDFQVSANPTPLHPVLFIEPRSGIPPTDSSMYWTLDRTCRRYLRVEFDVLPNVTHSNPNGPEGLMALYFNPNSQTGIRDSDPGPLAAVELTVEGTGKTPTPSIQVYGQSEIRNSLSVPLFLDSNGNPFPVAIPAFVSVLRSFRIEFAWDYYITPRDWLVPPPQPPSPPNAGQAWLFVRISYKDNYGNWVQILPPLNPATNLSDNTLNGWIPFGQDPRKGYSSGNYSPTPQGCAYYDWQYKSTASPAATHVHFIFQTQGSGSGTGNVTWTLDNVKLDAPTVPPFSLMYNQSGYDIAGPQSVAICGNDWLYRVDRTNDPVPVPSPPITSIIWELWDATGSNRLRSLTISAPPGQYVLGQDCFQDTQYPEMWSLMSSNPSYYNFDTRPIYWWVWTISPQVVDDNLGCYVRATINTNNSVWATLQTPPFDIKRELHYRALVPGVSLLNEAARHAVRTTATSFPDGGWFDAGNENGEARAHGTFVSALANTLLYRRSELRTSDILTVDSSGNPVSGYYEAIKFGADFLMKMSKPENSTFASSAHTSITTDPNGNADITAQLRGHYLNANDQGAMNGHIWEEHNSRYNGPPSGPAGDDAGFLIPPPAPPPTANKAERILNACFGLVDAARVLRQFQSWPLGADFAGYASQAQDTRSYLNATLPTVFQIQMPTDAFLKYRTQAMLDLLIHEYSANPADLTSAMTNVRTDLGNLPPATKADSWVRRENIYYEQVLYPPSEPLCFMIDRGFSDSLTPTWRDYATTIAQTWFAPQINGSSYSNPLSISKYWFDSPQHRIAHSDFEGDAPWANIKLLDDAIEMARLAQVLGRSDANYSSLVQLAIGNMNWVLGLHRGVQGRHLHPASDIEFGSASLVSGVGSTWVGQTLPGLHNWDTPTTVNGIGGSILDHGSSKGPHEPPWDYLTSDYDSSESYILTDGMLVMAAETLSRLLHPRLVIEAEMYSAVSSASMSIASNNSWPYVNGGLSLFGYGTGDWSDYIFVPVEPTVSGSSNLYSYDVMLRASNYSGANTTATITISTLAGQVHWTQTVPIPKTASMYDFWVIPSPSRVLLLSGSSFKLRVTFQGGPCGLDCIVLKSGGVPQ